MTFCSLLSHVYLLMAPLAVDPSLQFLYDEHLETVQGKEAFIFERIIPYAEKINALNLEVLSLTAKIERLSPYRHQQQIRTLSEELSKKMEELLGMLPVLQTLLTLDDDLNDIDTLLNQTTPLSEEQIKVVNSLRTICEACKDR